MSDFYKWLSDNSWAGWLILAFILGSFEMLTLDLTLLMLGFGAGAGALAAAIFPESFVLQMLVAIFVAMMMVLVLRPTLMERIRRMPGYRSGVQKLIGSSGTVTSKLNGGLVEVKVNGQIWRARPFKPNIELEKGSKVGVYEVDGITLVVYPRETERSNNA